MSASPESFDLFVLCLSSVATQDIFANFLHLLDHLEFSPPHAKNAIHTLVTTLPSPPYQHYLRLHRTQLPIGTLRNSSHNRGKVSLVGQSATLLFTYDAKTNELAVDSGGPKPYAQLPPEDLKDALEEENVKSYEWHELLAQTYHYEVFNTVKPERYKNMTIVGNSRKFIDGDKLQQQPATMVALEKRLEEQANKSVLSAARPAIKARTSTRTVAPSGNEDSTEEHPGEKASGSKRRIIQRSATLSATPKHKRIGSISWKYEDDPHPPVKRSGNSPTPTDREVMTAPLRSSLSSDLENSSGSLTLGYEARRNVAFGMFAIPDRNMRGVLKFTITDERDNPCLWRAKDTNIKYSKTGPGLCGCITISDAGLLEGFLYGLFDDTNQWRVTAKRREQSTLGRDDQKVLETAWADFASIF
ncbi:hypothetical protein TI39_contig445g00004 [Zymoseptoria brevis]|uniref:Uncharacterized protein n=1 Tax=Zymoseptoria brevis TaxID=1047168 RepID=A0A0F4GLT5_9PEZI|nr:hypothetical protein TI39_contig445g00004 [Zymoseptoria brevis]